jgi:hypothetical protein
MRTETKSIVIFIGLIGCICIGIVLFGLNIWAIILSGQALNNLVCSEQLKGFFIGSIVVIACLILGVISNYIILNNEDIIINIIYLFSTLGFWIFTLVWAGFGVGWIKNAISCNSDIIRSANIVLTILFVNSGIAIITGIFVIGITAYLVKNRSPLGTFQEEI